MKTAVLLRLIFPFLFTILFASSTIGADQMKVMKINDLKPASTVETRERIIITQETGNGGGIRGLANQDYVHNIFDVPMGEWDVSQWFTLVIFLMLMGCVFSTLIRCCCRGNICMDILACYCCYEICCPHDALNLC